MRVDNTVSLRGTRGSSSSLRQANEQRRAPRRACGAGIGMRPPVSRYCITVPIRPRRMAPRASVRPHSTSARPPCRYRLFVISKMKYGMAPARTAVPEQHRLLKCDFGKASELARMQALGFLLLEPFERLQADLEMLTDASPVEFAGHAGELDLAVQRLV